MILDYDKIVIGSSLEALMFAFNNELSVFFSTEDRPFKFDYIEPGVDLSHLHLENADKTLKTVDGEIKVGLPKELLWERLMFILSYFGKAPLANLCSSMRYTGDTLIFSDDYSKIAEISFNHCYYFGDKNCYKLLNEKQVDTDSYICYDWIAFNRGGKHEIDFIETNDNFVKHIWFFPSDRIDGNSAVKDACAVSYLNRKQLTNFDYSETMVRFKTIHEMESRGMKGKFNGCDPKGNPKYYKFRTTSIIRGVEKKNGTSESRENCVEIANYSEENLLKDISSSCLVYNRFLRIV